MISVSALISPLLAKWDPCAIARFIIAIVVAALDRKIVAVSIGKRPIAKRNKREPFTADDDATSTIILKPHCLRVTTSIEHTAPNSRKPGSAAVVDRVQLPADIDAPASAGFCVASSQIPRGGQDLAAAGTMAAPTDMITGIVAVTADPDDGQSTERLTCNISESGQGDLLTRLLRQVAGWRSNAGPSRILARSICT